MLEGRELSYKKLQMDSLDGLRGLAVLIVFFSHTSNSGVFLLPNLNFSGIGKSGVFLFFVLSAFLLTLPFLKRGKDAANPGFLANYALRRFTRIYPLYVLYLFLSLVTTAVLWKIFDLKRPFGIPFPLSFNGFIDHIFLMQGRGVTWSILVEFRFYFFIPLLALTYSIIFRNRLLPSIALTAALTVASQLVWPQATATVNDPRLGPYLPIFLMGSLLALIFHRWQESSFPGNKKARILVELAGVAAAITLVSMIPSVASVLHGKIIPFNYYHKEFITFGLLWSIVLFASVAGDGILKKFFSSPPLRYLGFISFSVYLLHVIAVGLIRLYVPGIPLQGWAMLLATIAISHITWTFVEKPSSKIRLPKQA